MGNLLGAPVTEKETHEGCMPDGSPYGVSSMQGWRVHMEDAHITEDRLYAAEAVVAAAENNSGAAATTTYNKIDLPGHALFAVFDGHGGSFAAVYSGQNLCRVLSRQPKFVEYAKFERERPEKEKTIPTATERAQYIRSGLDLLEGALRDAFVDLDREIACALKGTKVADADQPYHDDDDDDPAHNNDNSATAAGNDQGGGGNNNDDSMEGVTHSDRPTSPADSALQLLEEEGDSGTTACVVVLTPGYILCANAGDSRSVLSKLGHKAVPLSFDHKPDDEEEERRIRTAGGYVAGGRVEGDLAVSRGLGDFRFKNMDTVMTATSSNSPDGGENSSDEPRMHQPMMEPGDQKVSPIPDITIQSRNVSQDEFIIIACDGIWDVLTNYEAVKTVAELFNEGEESIGLMCEEICDICLTMGSKDNMTTLIVKFDAQKVGTGGGVLARRQLRDADNAEDNNKDSSNAPCPT